MRSAALLLCCVLTGCEFVNDPPKCHYVDVVAKGSVVPPDSLHLPTVTIGITETHQVCE